MRLCAFPSPPGKGNEAEKPAKKATTAREREQQHRATNSHARQKHQQKTKKHQPTREDENQQATTAARDDRDQGQTQQKLLNLLKNLTALSKIKELNLRQNFNLLKKSLVSVLNKNRLN